MYATWFLWALSESFIFGIYPIFLHSRGLDQFRINCVAAAFAVVGFLSDVPTGAFADHVSRRTSFVVGCALRAFSFFLYIVSPGFGVFIIADAIGGLGFSFANGALEAWAIDALDEAGFAGPQDTLFSRLWQLWMVASMTGAIAGAHLASFRLSLPWIVGLVSYVACAIVAARVMRRERSRGGSFAVRDLAGQLACRVGDGIRTGIHDRTVLLLSISDGLRGAAWESYWQEWPRYFMTNLHAGVAAVGYIYCAFSIAGIAGAEIANRFAPGARNRAKTLTLIAAVMSIGLLGAGLAVGEPKLALALLIGSSFAGGILRPLHQSWFNETLEGGTRATMLSFQSTVTTAGIAAGLPAGGKIADRLGVGIAWQVCGWLSMASAICYWRVRARPSTSPGSIADRR